MERAAVCSLKQSGGLISAGLCGASGMHRAELEPGQVQAGAGAVCRSGGLGVTWTQLIAASVLFVPGAAVGREGRT